MSFDAATLAEWTKMRDQLLARRTELLAELAAIQAALFPLEAPKPPVDDRRRHRRGRIDSLASRIESYVRKHPNMTASSIAAALGTERGPTNGTLASLAGRKFLVRYRGDGNHWHYALAPNVDPPPAPFQDTAAGPSGSPVDAPAAVPGDIGPSAKGGTPMGPSGT